ncbi:MAG: hypothetical protein KAT05_07725, partial [Spirochaetes bacterium]|nr:hypothetical protein [Spirochaetota bacterium]
HSLNIIKEEAAKKKYELEEIKLTKFNHDRLNRLIAGILGQKKERSHKLADFILEKSEGNPFFAITILRELVEKKALVWQDDGWQENWEKIRKIRISNNIIDMIIKRIKDLTEKQNKILCIASIIGREFEVKLLYNLVEYEKEEVIEIVDELILKQLIEKSQNRGMLLFIHDRVREAFQYKTDKAERKKIHINIAEAIEKLNKKNISLGAIHESPVLFELAYHYTEGENKDKSLEYVIPAAGKAKLNYANEEAIKYYKIGIGVFKEKGKEKSKGCIKAKEDLVDVYLTRGKSDEAIELANEILLLKEKKIEKAKIYRKIGMSWFKKGNWKECEEALAKGLELLGEKVPREKKQVIFSILSELITHILYNLFPWIFNHKKWKKVKEEDKEIIWFYLAMGWMYYLSDIIKFFRGTLRGPNIAQSRIGKSKELAISLFGYACLCMAIPIFKISIKYHNKGLKLREILKDEWGVAQSLQAMGFCYSWQGNYKKSMQLFEQSIEKFEKIGDMWELGMSINGLGHPYRYLCMYDKAIYNYNKYLDISHKIKDDYGISATQVRLSFCYLIKGSLEKAEELNKKGFELSKEKKIWLVHCIANINQGIIEIEKENYQSAIKYLENAKKIFEDNLFLKDYSIYVYPILAEAYIKDYIFNIANYKSKEKKQYIKKIKIACKVALKKTKSWVNHYGISLRASANYYALINKKSNAKKYFLKSINKTKALGQKYQTAKSYYEYGNFLQSINKPKQAIIQWQHAYNIFKEIGAKIYIKRCAQFLGYKEEEFTTDTTSQERLSSDRRMTTVLNTGRYL